MTERHVPLSVRTGNRRKRFAWWRSTQRENLALRLAPWLRGAERDVWVAEHDAKAGESVRIIRVRPR